MADEPTTAEPAKPRGRWFQFRLRTLLVGVALLAIPGAYVGHEAKIVSAQRVWIAEHRATVSIFKGVDDNRPSAIRRFLGDEDYGEVMIVSDADLAEAKALFPEAYVTSSMPGWLTD